MKYKFKNNSGTYMYKKKTIILKATNILAVQMLKFIGSFYWLYKALLKYSLWITNQQYVYMLRFIIVRCVFLLFYVLMKHIILYVWIQWCNKTTQDLLTLPLPLPPLVGRGYRLSHFWLAKEVNIEVKKEKCVTYMYQNKKTIILNIYFSSPNVKIHW